MARAPLFSLKRPNDAASSAPTPEQWHAVSIRCGRNSCAAVRDLSNQRYLGQEAPLLPLQNCDRSAHCECHYQHHSDRRDAPRRAEDGGLPSAEKPAHTERRCTSSRREEDAVNWDEPESEPSSPLEDTYYNYYRKPKQAE